VSEGIALPALAAFATAAILALLLTPIVRRYAHRFDVLDHPDERRVNTSPVPRGGGIAVAAAFVITSLGLLAADSRFGIWSEADAPAASEVVALVGGAALAALIGSLDDWFDLRARWQLAGQLVVAGVAVGLGITVSLLANPFGPGFIRLGGIFGAAFAVLWILGMINSINFIDGLDGLSSGVALIAALTLGTISLTGPIDQPAIALFCFAMAGALLGFLRWNLHPASIFVGTSGVMVIGYVLALLAILGSAKVAVALLVLGVPIIDTFWIIVRRLSEGRSPFSPDRGHIHHRLLDLGLSQAQTVLVIYAVCIVLAVLSLILSGTGQLYAFLGVFVVFGLGLYLLSRAAGRDDAT
jgi:UDP-GlcNAc:undecaprenyl-phosphate GlcNAc-1-phosphate transferase